MITLKLFNGVLERKHNKLNGSYISQEEGLIIEPGADWAKDKIIEYYHQERLSGNDLNKTFHKSWKKIKESTRYELLIHQILHYLSTYGTTFKGEVYIPDEVVELPNIKLKFKVIKSFTKEELTEKCLNMFRSGIALKQETADELITTLVDTLDYTFTGKEGIRNKEVIIKLADDYNIFPNNPTEFFRYIIYRTTGQTLLIKSPEVIKAIKDSSYNPQTKFKSFSLKKLAGIFNRFKPLFLAYKGRCPKTINKISKLSKKYHKPMLVNPLNEVTSVFLEEKDLPVLENAAIYQLLKALAVCKRIADSGKNSNFVYKIRNGKSFAKENKVKKLNKQVAKANFDFLHLFLIKKYNLTGKTFYFPKGIKYAVPTTEKMYVGNIPIGTAFTGKSLAVGVYWENEWGAHDLDISGITGIGEKVGWNARYTSEKNGLLYSGDMTNAPNGAVEYLHAHLKLEDEVVLKINVYSGSKDAGYKIVIGKGSKLSKDYMMNPNKLFAEIKTECIQRQMILGLFVQHKNRKQKFVLLNFGAGNARVSGDSVISTIARKALMEEWSNPLLFKNLVKILGGKIVKPPEKADYDFSMDVLEKDSFIKIFNTV